MLNLYKRVVKWFMESFESKKDCGHIVAVPPQVEKVRLSDFDELGRR